MSLQVLVVDDETLARFVFDVPIRGSLPLLYALALVFMWGSLGIGILVSAASRTVPQAMQLARKVAEHATPVGSGTVKLK